VSGIGLPDERPVRAQREAAVLGCHTCDDRFGAIDHLTARRIEWLAEQRTARSVYELPGYRDADAREIGEHPAARPKGGRTEEDP
jgi:hypothetical protein